jgi:membrane protease YdiL (CAAX protease family)
VKETTPTVGPDPAAERIGLWAVIGLIFVFSWPSVIPQILASWRGAAAVPPWVRLLQILFLAPGFVALAASALNGGRPEARRLLKRLVQWRAAPRLYAGVLLGPPLVMWLSVWISGILGHVEGQRLGLLPRPSAFLPTFLTYLLLNTEELAWRGYVLPRMQAQWSPLAASLVLGVIWAAFHAPYFLMKGGHPGGFTPLLFVLTVMPMTVILTGVFNASGGSVMLPHLFHQSVNAWAEALPYLPRFAGSRWPAAITTSALVAIATLIVLRGRPSMRRRLAA